MGLFHFLFGTTSKPKQTSASTQIKPFVFNSMHHQRYQQAVPVMGLQNCIRIIKLEKNTNGREENGEYILEVDFICIEDIAIKEKISFE